MRIALLANLKKNAPHPPGLPPDAWAELDSAETMDALLEVIRGLGHKAEFFEGNLSLLEHLPAFNPDLCFNLCEGHFGDARESHIPALLEMLRIPYTGAGVTGLALTLDKALTKQILIANGISTPPFQVFEDPEARLDPSLRFPLIVKPSKEGSGQGVTGKSVVDNEAALRPQVRHMLEVYQQPILVERYIAGREVTVGALGNPGRPIVPLPGGVTLNQRDGLHLLPIVELLFDSFPESERQTYSRRMKSEWDAASWHHGIHYQAPARLTPTLQEELEQLTARTFKVTLCRDLARVDFRLDSAEGDKPYVLEINALPGMSPGFSDMVLCAAAGGLAYDQLVASVILMASERLRS